MVQAPLPQGVTAKPVTFSRTVPVGALVFSAADKGWSFNTALSDLPNYTEFTNLFQSFRVRSITYRFTLLAASATTQALPVIYMTEAQIGGGTFAAQADVLQTRYRSHVLTSERPRASMTVRWPTPSVDLGASVQAGLDRGAWISTASGTGTVFLGINAWITNGNSTVLPTISLEEIVSVDMAGLR